MPLPSFNIPRLPGLARPGPGAAWEHLVAALLLLVASGHGPAALSASAEDPSFRLSLSRTHPTASLLLQLSAQGALTDRYLVLEQAPSSTGPFHGVQVLLPTGSSLTPLPLPSAEPLGFFRARSVSRNAPLDSDADGIDDLYEFHRRPTLDPLNPADAQLDADGDALDNLTEYRQGTESVPGMPRNLTDFRTLTALQATSPTSLGPAVHVGGWEMPDDGWGGWFRWVPDALDPADEALVVEPFPGLPGRLVRLLEPDAEIHAAWWRPDPTGIHEATDPLRQALAVFQSGPYRRFRFPPGRFRVAARTTLFDPSLAPLRVLGIEDFSLTGPGATLVADGDGDLLLLQNCHRGRITDLAFEGAGSDRGQTLENYALVQLAGTNTDLSIERCQFRHFMHGVSQLHGEKTSLRITVRDCLFEDGGDTRHPILDVDGAAVSGIGSHWLVENNEVRECARGIEVENTSKSNLISGVIIRGNRLVAVRNLGIMAFLGNAPGGTLQQSDNHILDNLIQGKTPRHRYRDGRPVPILGISINGGRGWQIRGNSVAQVDYAGISLYAAQADVADSVVSDNRVTGTTGRGIQILAQPPLHLTRVTLHHNLVSECVDRGILLSGDALVASGNVVDHVAVAGIAIGMDAQSAGDTLVLGNVISHVLDGAPAVLVQASRGLVLMSENILRSAAVGLRCAGTNCVLHNNQFIEVPVERDFLP